MKLALDGVGFCQRLAISAMMNDEVEQEHGHENCAKRNNDRGAGGSIDLHAEVTENEKNASDGDRRGDDEAEGGVEQEVPETDVEAEPYRFVMIDGDEEEFLAKDEVKNANCAVEEGGLAYLVP